MSDPSQVKIRVEGITRRFETRGREPVEALSRFDLMIGDGEFVCIVGPSGCGKSTFLRIVAGLLRPSSGTLAIRAADPARPTCATVFQEYSIFPWLTVAGNVRFGLEVLGVPRREADERAGTWLEKVGLHTFRDAYPAALSGGMKQRVALARALVVEPEVLLMDEPFAALDAQLRLVLQEELLAIWQEWRRTVILITHSIDEALVLGDRIVLMSARPGRVKEVIPVPFPRPRSGEVRNSPEFRALERRIWESLRAEVVSAEREGE